MVRLSPSHQSMTCLGLAVAVLAALPGDAAEWRVTEKPVRVVEGLSVPECACVDAASGSVYISNIATQTSGFWLDDGQAWITRLKPDGTLDALKWRRSTRSFAFSAPKGLCVLNRVLYAADIACVRCLPLDSENPPRTMQVPGAQRLNDMATDGRDAYVSDTGRGRVARLDLSGANRHAYIPAPAGVNGITFHQGRLYAVSWPQHEVYELDPSGRRPAKAFGLAKHFKGLDGIEVLDDGSFIVSDFVGGKVSLISPGRDTVRTLVELADPADIGLDRKLMRLFIPQFNQGRVVVYQLVRE